MADPISISSIVLQIGSLIQNLYQYGRAAQNAQTDILKLCGELSALKSVLSDFEARWPLPTEVVTERLQTTTILISRIAQDLEPRSRKHERLLQSLKWPYNGAQVSRALAEIERLKSWFLLRMMTDTHSDTKNIQAGLNALTLTVQGDVSERRLELASQNLVAIRKLLAPISPNVMHKKSCETSFDTPSGSWLLEGKFKEWLSSDDPLKRALVLTGRSGSGKTTIMSQAVEHARTLVSSDSSVKLGYFYSSFSNSASLELRSILGSWLVQIMSDEAVLLDRYKPYLADFTEVRCEHIEQSIASAGGTVLLFLDAINECREIKQISDCVERLSSVTGSTIIKCFITATPMFNLLCSHMQVDMLAESISPDIETYVRRKISQCPILQSVPQTRIVETLVGRANGMFRWVDCQIDILAAQRTPKLVLRTLENLPGTLNDTYSRLLNSIPVVDQKMVREALSWLCHALRPLALDELCEAVVYETEDNDIDDTCRLQPFTQLIQLCNGLVVLDEASRTVTLAHSSVRDFLNGPDIVQSTARDFALVEVESHRHILRKSLSYLSMDKIQTWYARGQSTLWWSIRYPLLNYITQNWCIHARRCQSKLDESDLKLVDAFLIPHRTLGARSSFTFWIRYLISMTQNYGTQDYEDDLTFDEVIEAAQPLYYMASFGFEVYIERIFAQNLIDKSDASGPWYIDHKCGRAFSTALQVACWRSSTRTVELILNEGADPNSTNSIGISCLGVAGAGDRHHIVAELLKHGARLNPVDERVYGFSMRDLEESAKFSHLTQRLAKVLQQHEGQTTSVESSTPPFAHHAMPPPQMSTSRQSQPSALSGLWKCCVCSLIMTPSIASDMCLCGRHTKGACCYVYP